MSGMVGRSRTPINRRRKKVGGAAVLGHPLNVVRCCAQTLHRKSFVIKISTVWVRCFGWGAEERRAGKRLGVRDWELWGGGCGWGSDLPSSEGWWCGVLRLVNKGRLAKRVPKLTQGRRDLRKFRTPPILDTHRICDRRGREGGSTAEKEWVSNTGIFRRNRRFYLQSQRGCVMPRRRR